MKQGIEATSIQQITDLCGISKGAFYLVFKSKDELIMAIIDHFMMKILSEIDYTVRHCDTNENMLYEFYYATFHAFSEHANFAHIFIKEQAVTFNEELIGKLTDYDQRMNQSILYMLRKLYQDEIQNIIYDLLICIKGFIRNYVELSFHYRMKINLSLFAKSLVEKTNILAQHMTTPFVTEEVFQSFYQPDSGQKEQSHEQIVVLIEQEIPETAEPIEKESLELLKDCLLSAEPSMAIVYGLLQNLRNNPKFKWMAYLINDYYKG